MDQTEPNQLKTFEKNGNFFQGHFAFTLAIAGLVLSSGVFLGAVGAHLISRFTPPNLLETFKTGVHYQIIHGLGILLIGLFELIIYVAPLKYSSLLPLSKLKWCRNLMLAGIFLFSFNCYMYAITTSTVFVILIPFGGVSFILSWFLLFLIFFKVWNKERLKQFE